MERLTLTPDEALARAEAGTLVLVDIRQPTEWAQTGVATPALTISVHEPDFLERLREALGPSEAAIGLICASGGRSAQLQAILNRQGFDQVHDVPEGMTGGEAGPGWIRRGLPIRRP